MSCIIPVYNGQRFLAGAIDSVLEQTHADVEVLVVDDASTDSTPNVARDFGNRVRYVRLESNRGPSAARNRGLAEASGELVAFLDADDLWYAEKLSKQLTRMPELDLCFTSYRHVWAEELTDEERDYQGQPMTEPCRSYCISTLLTRRSVFDRIGHFDEQRRFGENVSLFMTAVTLELRIDVLPTVLADRRFHADSVSRNNMPQSQEAFLGVLKRWRDAKQRNE